MTVSGVAPISTTVTTVGTYPLDHSVGHLAMRRAQEPAHIGTDVRPVGLDPTAPISGSGRVGSVRASAHGCCLPASCGREFPRHILDRTGCRVATLGAGRHQARESRLAVEHRPTGACKTNLVIPPNRMWAGDFPLLSPTCGCSILYQGEGFGFS